MRGSPFLQLVLITVVFALTGMPVWQLTHPVAAATEVIIPAPLAVETGSAKPVSIDVEVIFAPAPMDFQIRCLDQTVLEGHGPQARFSIRWTTVMPAEGDDLVLQAHWPPVTTGETSAGAPCAARLTVRFADGRQVEKSFWAGPGGTLAEVLTVPGTTLATATP